MTARIFLGFAIAAIDDLTYLSGQMAQVLDHPITSSLTLENGDTLTVAEFLRRYEAATELNKAQLIEGIVHMPSPVRAQAHAEPDGIIQLWLGTYSLKHPDLKVYPNSTLILDAENAVQPDAILCSTPKNGGRVWLNEKGYLCGAPEFICEIAASSASVDLHQKQRAYRRNGVGEYLVWLTEERRVLWFERVDDDFLERHPDPETGLVKSLQFPGLILDVQALLALDKRKVVEALA